MARFQLMWFYPNFHPTRNSRWTNTEKELGYLHICVREGTIFLLIQFLGRNCDPEFNLIVSIWAQELLFTLSLRFDTFWLNQTQHPHHLPLNFSMALQQSTGTTIHRHAPRCIHLLTWSNIISHSKVETKFRKFVIEGTTNTRHHPPLQNAPSSS